MVPILRRPRYPFCFSKTKVIATASVFLAAVLYGGHRYPANEFSGNRRDLRCERALASYLQANVAVVAFDMDWTLLNIHTGGIWQGTPETLARHVRPECICLLHNLLSSQVNVGVATFSSQVDLIEEVLQLVLDTETLVTKSSGSINNNSKPHDIPVVGWQSTPIPNFEKGKQGQLYHILRYFGMDPTNKTDRLRTILVDDDLNNIRIAQDDGYRVVPYYPEQSRDRNSLALRQSG